jgi:hypothetical protein
VFDASEIAVVEVVEASGWQNAVLARGKIDEGELHQ